MPAQERGFSPQPVIIEKPAAPISRVKSFEVPTPLQKIKLPPHKNPIKHHAELFTKSLERKPKKKKHAELWTSHIHDLRKTGHSNEDIDAFVGQTLARLEHTSKKSKKEAERDELTKMYSRKGIVRRFREVVSRTDRTGEKFSIVVADLDKFKTINDDYGHGCGDAVLRHTARHLRHSGRGHDIWGRLGGEEFIGILPGEHIGQAARAMERQRIHLPEAVDKSLVEEKKFTVKRDITMSVGIATYDPKAYEERFGTRQEQIRQILIRKKIDLSTLSGKDRVKALNKAEKTRILNILNYLTDKADQAMYKAKESGRDKVYAAIEAPHGSTLFIDARTMPSPHLIYDRMSA